MPDSVHIATIGGKNSLLLAIGTVKWFWDYDDVKRHTYQLKDVYYFPHSPVNILSVIEFTKAFNHKDVTGIDTKASNFLILLEHGKIQMIICTVIIQFA